VRRKKQNGGRRSSGLESRKKRIGRGEKHERRKAIRRMD